jgi:hypothetical protein
MSMSRPDVLTDGETIVVEAPTAEEALQTVAERLGADAEIVSVEKVHRGGLGGFFARELVQIHARRPQPSAAQEAPPMTDTSGEEQTALQRVLAALAGDADAQERTFQDALRRQLSTLDPAAAAELGMPGVGVLGAAAAHEANAAAEAVDPAQEVPPPPIAVGPLARGESLDAPSEPHRSVRPPDDPTFQERVARSHDPERVARSHDPERVARSHDPERVARSHDPERVARSHDPERVARSHDPERVARSHDERVAASAPREPAARRKPEAERERDPEPAVEPEPAVFLAVAPGMPEWSVENLQRRGLPPLVVDAVRDLDPRDDLAWVHAIGRSLATLCRPLPAGDAVFVGPRAPRLAAAFDAPVVEFLKRPPRKGSFAAALRDTEQHREWLAWARGTRWLHVVLGGTRWRDFLFDEPLALSWTSDDDLPEALGLCAELGLVLGYRVGSGRDARAVRANPVDLAVAIRDLMPRR